MSLWPFALGVGGAAVAAGILSIPVARRAAFGRIGYDWQGRELDLDRIDPDGFTVMTKSGIAMRCWRLGGMAYETKPEAAQIALHQGRRDFLHQVARLGLAVRLFGVKRRCDVSHAARWPSPTLQEIGDAETALFRASYDLRWYMTIAGKDIVRLEEATQKVASLLAAYHPRRLERAANTSCPLTGFLNFLMSGDLRDDLFSLSSNISVNLPSADLAFERRSALVRVSSPAPLLYRVIAIRAWPDQTSGHLLHDLMRLDGEIEISQVAIPISSDVALALLHRKEREAAFNPFGGHALIEECAAAQSLLSEDATAWATTQAALILRARDEAALDALTEAAARVLGHWRVTSSVETAGAPVVWFNRLPDRDKLLRPLKLFSENISALWPFQYAPVGLLSSQFGPGPLRSFRTGSGQSYAFQFQCSAKPKSLGNFVVFAPSGSGKTTLLLHLLSGLARHQGVRSYIFDSKEGARFTIEAMGGVYQTFDRLALNPLDVEDTPRTRQQLQLLIRSMLGEVEAGDDVLSHVVNTAFQVPRGERTFSALYGLTFPAHSEARRAFAKWIVDDRGREGLYSHVFNAPRDSLGGFLTTSCMAGINMNEVLSDPSLGPPVVAHIANAIETAARSGDSKGFAIFVDEAANLLRNEGFKTLAKEMYREYRKLDGAVGLAFQDPGALAQSGIAEAVLENTAALIFFPNPQANRAAYDVFNLNDEQRSFIWSGAAHGGRKVLLVKRDPAVGWEESVILDIDLSGYGKALRLYRSGPDAVRELVALQQQWGEQWLAHV